MIASVVEAMRSFEDPYPYIRGMIAEIGLPYFKMPYNQPRRQAGDQRENSTFLFFVRHRHARHYEPVEGAATLCHLPGVRLLAPVSACRAGLSRLQACILVTSFLAVGIAPLVIGLFFLGSVQLLSMGILGEYIGSIYTHRQCAQAAHYVIERERINFTYEPGMPL